jgi:hypothetical protein
MAYSLDIPSVYNPSTSTKVKPLIQSLLGKWYVTHTTLPYFRDKWNLQVDYALIPSHNENTPLAIDDLSTYETSASSVRKSIHGTDTVIDAKTGKYKWRGNGWLRLASSHWEILGVGVLNSEQSKAVVSGNLSQLSSELPQKEVKWLVVYAEKTIFSPAAISISTQCENGLPKEVVSTIIETLKTEAGCIDNPALDFINLIETIYEAQKA